MQDINDQFDLIETNKYNKYHSGDVHIHVPIEGCYVRLVKKKFWEWKFSGCGFGYVDIEEVHSNLVSEEKHFSKFYFENSNTMVYKF